MSLKSWPSSPSDEKKPITQSIQSMDMIFPSISWAVESLHQSYSDIIIRQFIIIIIIITITIVCYMCNTRPFNNTIWNGGSTTQSYLLDLWDLYYLHEITCDNHRCISSDNHYNPSKSSSPANEVASVSGCCQAAVSGGPEHPLNDVVP